MNEKDVLNILTGLRIAQELANMVNTLVHTGGAGNIDPIRFQQLKTQAGVSDQAWDDAVAAAKLRIANNN